MQAKAFQSACSCRPGSQVGAGSEHSCPGQAALSQLHLHVPAKKPQDFTSWPLRIYISHREQGEGGENGGDARTRRHHPYFRLHTKYPDPTRFAAAIFPCVLFSRRGPELWPSPAHLRPGAACCHGEPDTISTTKGRTPRAPRLRGLRRGNNSVLRFPRGFFTSRGFSNADSFINNFLPFKNKAYLIPQNTPIALDYHNH